MKKLNKLQINSEKLMKNEDLLILRGGYGSYLCYRLGGFGGCTGGFISYINTAGDRHQGLHPSPEILDLDGQRYPHRQLPPASEGERRHRCLEGTHEGDA